MRPVDTPPGLRPDPSAARPVAGLRADPGAAEGPLLLDERARTMQPPRKDPSPSRWAWRLERLMLTPLFLLTLRAGVPFVICLALGTIWLSDPARQQRITETVAETRASIEERPEFMVQLMAIDGAPDPVSRAIRE
ncbi:MAG: cell division protein FtsQ, partial [Pseudomonadota bacterium]